MSYLPEKSFTRNRVFDGIGILLLCCTLSLSACSTLNAELLERQDENLARLAVLRAEHLRYQELRDTPISQLSPVEVSERGSLAAVNVLRWQEMDVIGGELAGIYKSGSGGAAGALIGLSAVWIAIGVAVAASLDF